MWHYIATLICPVIFVMGLAFAPNGIWKLGRKLSGNESIKKLVEKTQKEELKKISAHLLAGFKDDKEYQISKITKAIDYSIGRHDWYEIQRTNIFKNILSVCGLFFVMLGLYARIDDKLEKLEILIILSIGLTVLVAVCAALYFYNAELDRDRPYRLVSDIRHWYFRYSLPERATHYSEHLDVEKLASDVIAERKVYVDRIVENAPIEKSVREDIEQLFILHLLQRYKHESLQKMRWLFNYFVATIFFEGVWYFSLIYVL